MFCGKCGARIEDGVKFCPQCGTPLQAAESKPDTVATTYKQSANKLSPVAVTAYVISALIAYALVRLWTVDSIAISGLTQDETTTLFEIFDNQLIIGITSIFPLFMVFMPIIKLITYKVVLRISKSDSSATKAEWNRIIASPFLPGLCLIWNIVFYVMGIAKMNDEVAKYNGLLKVRPNAFGWLYIMCCIALCVLVVLLLVIYFKSSRENSGARGEG